MKPKLGARARNYRDLVLAIALFLVLDLGVLVFNFYASGRIAADTSKINASGELRMYSQQLTKAVLTLAQETRDGMPFQTSQAQITESYQNFSKALTALSGRQDANPLTRLLSGASIEQEAELLQAVATYWQPIDSALAPVLHAMSRQIPPDPIDVEITVNKLVARNIRLMQLANDLTQHLEQQAMASTRQLRTIQVAAIMLALVNFAFIILKFVRALRQSDRAAEAAREETEEILDTLREGLFLLNRDGTIGSQRSASLERLFDRELRDGERFAGVLGGLVSAESASVAMEYVDLLFHDRIKGGLLGQLNPLDEVALSRTAEGARETRHLSFDFAQVRRDGKVIALLVSVHDISEKVRLRRELAGAEEQARGEVELLLAALDQQPALITAFLDAAQAKCLEMNEDLRQVEASPRAYAGMIDRQYRAVHTIKGEAGLLGFGHIEREAHQVEEELSALRGRRAVNGNDLIPLAVALNALRQQLERLREISAKVRGYAGKPVLDPLDALLRQVERFTRETAKDLAKEVEFEAVATPLSRVPPALAQLLREAVPQLVRNAVVHGIESADERLRAGKSAAGRIRVVVEPREDDLVAVSVWDDGRGICADTLRHELVALGRKSKEEVAQMNDREVVAQLFEPGFSTATAVNRHAGRGVGLDLIRALLTRLGASLRVSSQPKHYTKFTLLVKA
jgi:signal transduction histidine kinase